MHGYVAQGDLLRKGQIVLLEGAGFPHTWWEVTFTGRVVFENDIDERLYLGSVKKVRR